MKRLARALRHGLGVTALLAGILAVPTAAADALPSEYDRVPVIGIIIDDLGNQWQRGQRVVDLPGPVACAFLPHSPYTRRLAQQAHSVNKEVMLHLPMQTVGHHALGPGGLTLDMTEQQFIRTLQDDLAAVPHVTGINNHMGSLLTRHPGHMMWLMRGMQQASDPMFFVDSRTTVATVARRVAQEQGVPSLARDIFLDSDSGEGFVQAQFERLVAVAHKTGTALAIGHPYPGTLAVLERELAKLHEHGVRLVPISRLIELRQGRRATWQASLSP